jgi:hypothetical protein
MGNKKGGKRYKRSVARHGRVGNIANGTEGEMGKPQDAKIQLSNTDRKGISTCEDGEG